MRVFSIGEVIEMAIQTEKLGSQFYADMALKFNRKTRLKKLFTTLSEKEKKHERVFAELKDLVGGREPMDWPEAQSYFRAVVESEFFLGSGKSATMMRDIKTSAQALDYAIGFEKETLVFYLGLKAEVREKHLIDKIIAEERSHLIWLATLKESLGS